MEVCIMKTKEEAEKELNILHDLFIRYVNDDFRDDEKSIDEKSMIQYAERHINDIVLGRDDISLDENISDEQILAIYNKYLKRTSGIGSQELGIGADVAKGAKDTAPFAVIALIVGMNVKNTTGLVEVILAHQVIMKILGIGEKIVIEVVKKWSK